MKANHIVRFSTVGVINTVIDAAVFTAVVYLTSAPAYVAQIAGYGAGMLNSFIMNKTWTFRKSDSGSGLAGEILRFFTVNAFSLAISANVMWLLADIIKIPALAAKVLVLVLTQGINYAGYKFWVFNE